MGVERVPFIWFWPDGAPSCLMMTHDVETTVGVDFAPKLDGYGRCPRDQSVLSSRARSAGMRFLMILSRKFAAVGFEVNVHDLKHDGSLFQDHARVPPAGGIKSMNIFAISNHRVFAPAPCIETRNGFRRLTFPMTCQSPTWLTWNRSAAAVAR